MKKIYANNDTDRSFDLPGSQSQDQNNKKVPQILPHVESKIFSIPRFLVFFNNIFLYYSQCFFKKNPNFFFKFKFSSTYFKRISTKHTKEPSNSYTSRKVKIKESKNAQNKKPTTKLISLHKKSSSLENKDFIKFFNSNVPVINDFKILSTEFTTTLNTHTAFENGTFITMQNNENEEEEKKSKVIPLNVEKNTTKNDKLCVVDELQIENFHHFPKETNVNKVSNFKDNVKHITVGKINGGKKKKRIDFKTKSLQMISDEGIIISS